MTGNILIINGSYRNGGVTDQAVDLMRAKLAELELTTSVINLRECEFDFCLNCRECMQKPGSAPGRCVQQDDMESIITKIEVADGYILAAPTNLGSVTAVFKKFMERLAVYAYWPWGNHAPIYRKDDEPRKKAILITSSSAPGFLGRWFFGTTRQLKYTARILGADPVGVLYSGLVAKEPDNKLPHSTHKKIAKLAAKLC